MDDLEDTFKGPKFLNREDWGPAGEPTQLGTWKLLERIGEGSWGVVYRARHPHLSEERAVKVLRPAIAAEEGERERFLKEANALSKFGQCPFVVSVMDVAEDENYAWIVMELIEGVEIDGERCPSLKHLLAYNSQRNPDEGLDSETVRRVTDGILRALEFVHDLGALHRDLKPANILLAPDGTAKVADFGLIKLLDTEMSRLQSGASVRHNDDASTNAIVGTISYMSPEQKLMEGTVGRRSDLYSAGLIVYEMITGSIPGHRIKLPGDRGLDPTWDSWLDRALETKPDDRWQSAREMRKNIPDNSAQSRLPQVQGLGKKIALGAAGLAALLLLWATSPWERGSDGSSETPSTTAVAEAPAEDETTTEQAPPQTVPANIQVAFDQAGSVDGRSTAERLRGWKEFVSNHGASSSAPVAGLVATAKAQIATLEEAETTRVTGIEETLRQIERQPGLSDEEKVRQLEGFAASHENDPSPLVKKLVTDAKSRIADLKLVATEKMRVAVIQSAYERAEQQDRLGLGDEDRLRGWKSFIEANSTDESATVRSLVIAAQTRARTLEMAIKETKAAEERKRAEEATFLSDMEDEFSAIKSKENSQMRSWEKRKLWEGFLAMYQRTGVADSRYASMRSSASTALEELAWPFSKPLDLSGLFSGSAYSSWKTSNKADVLKKVQSKLKTEGLYSSSIDGKTGPGTQEAIFRYQETKGLSVTGRLDDATLSSLGLSGLTEPKPASPPKPPNIVDGGSGGKPPASQPSRGGSFNGTWSGNVSMLNALGGRTTNPVTITIDASNNVTWRLKRGTRYSGKFSRSGGRMSGTLYTGVDGGSVHDKFSGSFTLSGSSLKWSGSNRSGTFTK